MIEGHLFRNTRDIWPVVHAGAQNPFLRTKKAPQAF